MENSTNNLLSSFEQKLNNLTKSFTDLKASINNSLQALNDDITDLTTSFKTFTDTIKNQNTDKQEKNDKTTKTQSDIIKLNIGGKIFSTLKSTLMKKIKDQNGQIYPPNIFEELIKDSKNGDKIEIFIDQNPKNFSYILDYLRDVDTDEGYELPDDIDKKELHEEAKFYKIKGLEESTNDKPSIMQLKPPEKMESKILSQTQIKELYDLCHFKQETKWKLLYRATIDGFQAKDFHSKCDGFLNTLTVVKTTDGYIFGGFTEKKWDCSDFYKYKSDPKAFLFSLKNYKNTKQIIKVSDPSKAIFCDPNHGPSFGEDVYIGNDSNKSNNNYSTLGICYANDSGFSDLLTDKWYFKTSEIEVFQKI